jgi:hypothetical protein
MESDSIRASGKNTLVDIWVNGKIRAVSVSREAVETSLGTKRPMEMSEEDRCEFVRTHLPLIVTAVKAQLSDTDPDSDTVLIEVGQLSGSGGRTGDRRKAERRTGERRKLKTPVESLPGGERRRSQRRTKDRRSPKS